MDQLKAIMKDLQTIEVKMGQLEWVQYTAGYDFGIEETNEALMEFLKNKEHYDDILKLRDQELTIDDQRCVELAYKAFEGYHKSDEVNQLQLAIENKTNGLSKILNTFRFKLDGKEVTSVELTQILMNNEDRELRKKAYLSRNQINKPMVDGGLLDLISMRKELAFLNGFEDFVAYKLDQDDLEPEIFQDWQDQVNDLLPEMNRVRKEFANKYLNDDHIMPWDEMYLQGLIAPSLNKKVDMLSFYEVISEFFGRFGYDLDHYNITYDVYSRKNKSEWGYNFPIEVAKDSRILANVKDRFHEYNVLMHETGHGAHSFLMNPDETILNRGVSGIISEGIANLFGSMIFDETFYSQFFQEDLEKVKEEFDNLSKWKKVNALRSIALIMFDQNFYRQDITSLDEVHAMYWKTFGDILGDEPGDFEPPWAFKIHHTTHPIYLHNYFMGDVTCEMLRSAFKKKWGVDQITDKPKEFGDFLYNEVVKPSGRYTYSKLFKSISGDKFSLKYMIE